MGKNSSYQLAGVDIEAGNEFVNRLKPHAKKTLRPEVLDSIGGFASLCSIPTKYKEPVLVSATDGVGTKLKIASALKKYDTLGIDLVAMCVNDVLATGAEPLFFLDYYACGQLNLPIAEQIIAGIAEGCLQSGCSLIGGETAEMPGVYPGEDYDLAGFCVGVVEKSKRMDTSRVCPGDALIAIGSSGVHSNGYSLVRHILANTETQLSQPFESSTLGEVLLTPTKIYAKTITTLLEKHEIHALAHITGGGLLENIPRVLPLKTQALIDKKSWQWLAIFQWLQNTGNIADQEMWQTFNCGVGFVVCVPKDEAEAALNTLSSLGEKAWLCGKIAAQELDTPTVLIQS